MNVSTVKTLLRMKDEGLIDNEKFVILLFGDKTSNKPSIRKQATERSLSRNKDQLKIKAIIESHVAKGEPSFHEDVRREFIGWCTSNGRSKPAAEKAWQRGFKKIEEGLRG